MRISDVLRHKGPQVATLPPSASVSELIAALADHNIGAMVVLDADTVVGIVSERDVVRQLKDRGADLLAAPVSEIMTTSVFTCAVEDTVDGLGHTMTERRIRHVPVLTDGRLVGIVSIGDVVKTRIDELETDRQQLEAYITQAR
ncbi:MAG: CBS domain-containing protein [Micromonosporaceae bacterium]